MFPAPLMTDESDRARWRRSMLPGIFNGLLDCSFDSSVLFDDEGLENKRGLLDTEPVVVGELVLCRAPISLLLVNNYK